MKFANILLLAGGQSTRFAPLSDKALFVFNGKPLVQHQIERYLDYTDNLVVACNKETESQIQTIASQYNVTVTVQEQV